MNVHCSTVYNGKKFKKETIEELLKQLWNIHHEKYYLEDFQDMSLHGKKKKLQNDIKALYVNLSHIYTERYLQISTDRQTYM